MRGGSVNFWGRGTSFGANRIRHESLVIFETHAPTPRVCTPYTEER